MNPADAEKTRRIVKMVGAALAIIALFVIRGRKSEGKKKV